LYKFFRVGSEDAYNDYYFNQKLKVSFRLTLQNQKNPHVIASWLRQGEIQAEKLTSNTYNKDLFLKKLIDIKAVMASHPVDFFKQLQDICLEAGVKVVYTPSLRGGSIHGSTRWINDTPLIQMSAKYKQNDIFWFTFFHEVGHIILHGKKYVALENVTFNEEDKIKEKEADSFAIKWVFSEIEEEEVLNKIPLDEEDILSFAKKFKTHPAMIIGRFHYKKLLHFSVGRQFIEKIEIIN
jgi:Zn-dependent peptidase ImmA (M78 family)